MEPGEIVTWWREPDRDEPPVPVKTTGPDKRWPFSDADGRKMYDNSHFRTEDEAWKRTRDNARAWQSLEASAYRQAQATLAKVVQQLADAAARVVDVERAFMERGPRRTP